MSQAERDTLTRQRELLHELWPWAAMLPPDTVVYPDVDFVTAGATLIELRSRPGNAPRPCGMCWPASVHEDRWGCCTCGQPMELHGLNGIAWLLERLWALLPPLDVVRAVNRTLGPCDRPRAVGRVAGFEGGPAVCRCGHCFDAHTIEDLRRALTNAVIALVARDGAPDEGVMVGLTCLLEDVTEPSLAIGADGAPFAHAEHFAIPAGHRYQFSTCRAQSGATNITFDPPIGGPSDAIHLAFLRVGTSLLPDAETSGWTPLRELRLPHGEMGESIVGLLENRSEFEARVLVTTSFPGSGNVSEVPCDAPLGGTVGTLSCVRCGIAFRNHDPLDLVEALARRLANNKHPDAQAALASIAEDAQLDVIEPKTAKSELTGFTLPAGVDPVHVMERLAAHYLSEPENLLVDRLAGAAKLLLQKPENSDTIEAWLVDTHRLLARARGALESTPELLPDEEQVALLGMELALVLHDLRHVGHVAEARLVCLRTQLARLRFLDFDRDSVRLPEFEGHPAPAAELPVSLAPEDDAHTTHLRSPSEAHPSGGETRAELGPEDEATVDDDSSSCWYELVEGQ